jgi:predicted transcriptional regulator
LTNLQLDVVDDLASSIRLAQLDGLELQHTSSIETATRSVSRPQAINFVQIRYWTRCLVNVRDPFSESTMIVSSAKKKVN